MLYLGPGLPAGINWPVDAITRKTNAFITALAATIRELRVQKGLSLNELATRSGLSQPSIGYIEKGQRRPTLESLSRLAIALGTSVSQMSASAEKRVQEK